MTIGPEPITRTERMDASRGTSAPRPGGDRRRQAAHDRDRAAIAMLGHLGDELAEEIVAVVRSGARLGVVLDREDGEVAMAEALDGAVVQVHVRQLERGIVEERGIHREAVVLRGDLDLSGAQVLHRMVRPTVAELELEGLAAAGEPEDLVAEADAKDGPRFDELAGRLDRVIAGLGIAGAIREEDAVRLERERFL